MNPLLERLVILVGMLQTPSINSDLKIKHLEELESGMYEILKALEKEPRNFSGAELVIMDWLRTVMRGIQKVQDANDRFDSNNGASGVA